MIKRRVIFASQAILLALSSLSFAQAVTEPPAAPLIEAEVSELFKKAALIANEDLSHLKHPVKPMLWKVEGGELQKASYLFGSMHVSDENICTLHPDAEAAYQQADTIATEISMSLMNQLSASQMMIRKDGKTLKESIGEELHTDVNTELAAIHEALSTAPFEQMKTWSVTIILGMIEEAMTGRPPLDLQLWERAGNDKKERWALETTTEQLGGFDQMTEEEQIIMLKDFIFGIRLLKKEELSMLSMLKNLYLKGEILEGSKILQRLGEIEGTNQEIAKKFKQIVLFDRNDRMTAKIRKTFAEQPDKSHFIVAGTLHFVGKHNVPELLRKQGYTVTKQ